MFGKRLARLNEQLKRELSALIRTAVRDPRVGLVTITGVDVARDLGSAKVYVRTTDEDRDATIEGLTAAAPFLRTLLGRVLRIRRVPELRFHTDRSLEHARRIEDVLDEVSRERDRAGPTQRADDEEPE
jgi:ribosome-binding factor A